MEDEGRASSSPDFGTLLRQYRIAAGLSQEALAERARMSTNGIGALERGYRRTPQRETLALLAKALALDGEQRRIFEAAATRSGAPRRPRTQSVAVGVWDSAASSLPVTLTSFVGREAELAEIAALMRDHRLVTITGSGGVGKTQTALRVGRALGNGEGSVRFVGLAAVTNPSLVPAAVASAVGAQELPNRSTLQTLAGYLKNKTLLLIFDNCEQVIDEVAVVADALLQSCPHLQILATSREPLRAAGEQTYRLPSLSVVEATTLFEDRARAVNNRFLLTGENALTVAELCRRLDGIPLAIELAAARANLLSVEELTAKLDERFRILTTGERTALPRQQTMRAAIDWSYDLLSLQERRLFERLSVFVGGCTLEAVEAVAPDSSLSRTDVFDLLSSLAEKSLFVVDREDAESRYRLLESTRAFALEKLTEHSEHEAVARRHAVWIADLADRAAATALAIPVEDWVGTFEPELENARAAIDWASACGEISLAARIACGLTELWRLSHGYAEPRRWLELLLSRVDVAADPGTAARIWHALATVTLGMHSVEAAQRALELDTFDNEPDKRVVAFHQISAGLLEAGRVDEAEAANQRALQLSRESGLSRSRRYAAALDLRAQLAAAREHFDEARQYYSEALSLTATLGEEHETDNLRINMGELEYRANHIERALEFADAAVAAARRIRSRHREATALVNSSAYRLTLGDLNGAHADARDALALSRWASSLEVAAAIQHLATVTALRGDAGRGARLYGYVDSWYRSEGCERGVTERRTREILMAALHEKLTAAEIDSNSAEGAQLSEEEAVTEALAV
jgi:predicted ATPase/transcriptional regulator with XRE-family HTH domain